MSTTRQRAVWDSHPVPLGTAFDVRRSKRDRELRALCTLRSHQLGWELVLEVNGLLARSQVCRSRDEVLDVAEQRHSAMREQDWR
jgi:hypothetical protein